MPRYPSRYTSSISFGPGPVSTAIKALIGANVVMFLAQGFAQWEIWTETKPPEAAMRRAVLHKLQNG